MIGELLANRLKQIPEFGSFGLEAVSSDWLVWFPGCTVCKSLAKQEVFTLLITAHMPELGGVDFEIHCVQIPMLWNVRYNLSAGGHACVLLY